LPRHENPAWLSRNRPAFPGDQEWHEIRRMIIVLFADVPPDIHTYDKQAYWMRRRPRYYSSEALELKLVSQTFQFSCLSERTCFSSPPDNYLLLSWLKLESSLAGYASWFMMRDQGLEG
jgi:hypothetical protein